MKVSVVTVSFNQGEFLERAICSVIGQSGVDVEYIVVDPGSTDGSREIIDRYKDRISRVVYEEDEGPADGLNRGFEFASGDVYCYLNSDDTFEPDALCRAARFLSDHPEFDVICGHAWVTDRHDTRLRRVWSEPFTRLGVAYGAAVQIQPSTFIRRAAFMKCGGFNPANRSGWDGELLVDLFLSGSRIGIVDEFLSTYRLHADSITNSGRLSALSERFNEYRFLRLTGRSRRPLDGCVAIVFRLWKHLFSPLATWERFTRGPVFNRGID
ncbi:MAG: glycosyltransferase family 2 protein [Rhizomicrobium sp.]